MVCITFIHPDLGIGGAERLIVDAAVALKKNRHDVHIITAHHDSSHCFPETTNGFLPVTVVGDWLPRSVFGRFCALCAYIRMLYAALYLIFFSDIKTDIAICDQVSACIPVLHFKIKTVIFYCHFPDLLQSKPGSSLKTLYRAPLNWIEEVTTGLSDVILVNSEFTRSTFKNTFKTIQTIPKILYPSVNTKFLDEIDNNSVVDLSELGIIKSEYFLSINRYERKKNLNLAIEAFAQLKHKVSSEQWSNFKLVVTGGYDVLVQENIEYFDELRNLAEELEISQKVVFLKSSSDAEKIMLLKNCRTVLYTPSNEHFGIVPLEAMYFGKPIIAVCSGGPLETVLNKTTGFLCAPNAESFADAMQKYVIDEELANQMGHAAKKRFEENFSFDSFSNKLNEIILDHIS
ncbi:alpha-1,3/1,6-mannosyltransferase ALG2 [Planococcus citri]|uniref:alpha-1,3/1,6-mannosyltransferase ALG2 n=1 Tax=Planococcus citri TaxID=170843 RepID=UPI0031F8B530